MFVALMTASRASSTFLEHTRMRVRTHTSTHMRKHAPHMHTCTQNGEWVSPENVESVFMSCTSIAQVVVHKSSILVIADLN